MDYDKHYQLLVERARDRVLDEYTEVHHIVPRCMGGDDSVENLVSLTAEEHYVAHQLLVKMYPNNSQLVYAANVMSRNSNNQRPNNKQYGWLRLRFAETHSKHMKGRKFTKEHKEKISKARTGYVMSQSTRDKLSKINKGVSAGEKNPMYGKSAVRGRRWYYDSTQEYLLFPSDTLITKLNLSPGRASGEKQRKWYHDEERSYLLYPSDPKTENLRIGRSR